MEQTSHYNLKKPEYTDQADIGDINDNMEIIDNTMYGMKTKQTVVGDPTASGTASAFIDSITQDANGKITATKKNITNVSVSNKGATLAWNTTSTIATVAGTNITAKLPANPNTNTWRGYQIKTYNYTPDFSGISANGHASLLARDFGVSTPSGYTPVAVLSYELGTHKLYPYAINAAATGSGTMMKVKNTSSDSLPLDGISIKILYLQT